MFASYYGPLLRAWSGLDSDGQQSLRDQLIALAEDANRESTGALIVPADYLQAVITVEERHS